MKLKYLDEIIPEQKEKCDSLSKLLCNLEDKNTELTNEYFALSSGLKEKQDKL